MASARLRPTLAAALAPTGARTPARGRARAWGGVAVVGRNQGDREASSAVGPLLGGDRRRYGGGPRARHRSQGKGAGSWGTLERGAERARRLAKRAWSRTLKWVA